MALPAREPSDGRIRVGCVHGCTFDIDGYQTNFPIARDAGVLRGLNYLAIGDTHSFRDVTPGSSVPTVYPGAPEPTTFDEPDAGVVALVALFRQGLRPRVSPERVGFWRWIDVRCRDLNELRALLTRPELERHVVRLHLDMAVSVAEESEIDRIVRELHGTDAAHGRAGIILVDRSGLRLVPGSIDDVFPENLPPVVKETIDKLDRIVSDSHDEHEKEIATRALSHLYKLLQTTDDEVGRLS
jgi:DNA repair exonuclease SbcCD nuclease subunit